MKKSLLAILFSPALALSGVDAFAQTNVYHPFPDSNAVWNQTSWYLSSNVGVTEPHVLFLSGDTVISGLIYKKILSNGYVYYIAPKSCCDYYNKYKGAVREDIPQRKIYFVPPSASGEQLIYDFSLNVGDTLPGSILNSPGTNYISSIDSMLIGSNYRKQFHVSMLGSAAPSDSNYVQLIEGIGSTFGLLSPLGIYVEGSTRLNCFIENQSVLYTYPSGSCNMTVGVAENKTEENTVLISPNPSAGVVKIESQEKAKFSIYDIFGREVYQSTDYPTAQSTTVDLSSQPKGIYFVRAKFKDGIVSRKIILQ